MVFSAEHAEHVEHAERRMIAKGSGFGQGLSAVRRLMWFLGGCVRLGWGLGVLSARVLVFEGGLSLVR